MKFFVNHRCSCFSGFCPQFGGVNTLQKQAAFSGSLCLNASDQVEVEGIPLGKVPSVNGITVCDLANIIHPQLLMLAISIRQDLLQN